MDSYTLLSGEIVDLRSLSPEGRRFLSRLKATARKKGEEDYFDLLRAVKGPGAFPLRGGPITPEVAVSPLYRVAHDIVDRVGIEQGYLLPPGAAVDMPRTGEWISMTQAAELIGVSRTAVHQALLEKRLEGLRVGNAWTIERRRAIAYKERREAKIPAEVGV
ncbi:MAG: hypothetical protein AB1714_01140 [Acidobacteriota bacterium]